MSPSLEIAVRVGGSAVVFSVLALWEWFAPRRRLTVGGSDETGSGGVDDGLRPGLATQSW